MSRWAEKLVLPSNRWTLLFRLLAELFMCENADERKLISSESHPRKCESRSDGRFELAFETDVILEKEDNSIKINHLLHSHCEKIPFWTPPGTTQILHKQKNIKLHISMWNFYCITWKWVGKSLRLEFHAVKVITVKSNRSACWHGKRISSCIRPWTHLTWKLPTWAAVKEPNSIKPRGRENTPVSVHVRARVF